MFEIDVESAFKAELEKKENNRFNSVFRLHLGKNIFEPARISPFLNQEYRDRFETNNDYRQMMLFFVLGHVDKYERERVIQMLLPERVITHLSHHEKLSCEFHENRNNQRLCHHLVIKRLSDSPVYAFMGIEGAKEEAVVKKYKPGNQTILFIKGEHVSSLQKQLENIYPVICTSFESMEDCILKHFDVLSLIILDSLTCHNENIEFILEYLNKNYKEIPVLYVDSRYPSYKEGVTDFVLHTDPEEVIFKRVEHLIALKNNQELLKMVKKDAVTGFYTKEFFESKAYEQLKNHSSFYVVRIVLDDLYVHIKNHGEVVSDMILSHMISQIKNKFPKVILAGRLSENDFVLLCENVSKEQCESFIETMKHGSPIPNIHAKIGIAYGNGKDSMDVLLNQAQRAIDKICQSYNENTCYYDQKLKEALDRKQMILNNMEIALEQHQYQIYYQPKHGRDESVQGAEALVRWHIEGLGDVSPSEFIPLFERVGFIRGLDRFVFVKVCQDICRWRGMGLSLVPISINLSRRDFDDPKLADWILHITNQMHIDPSLIHLEITESSLSDNSQRIIDCVQKLHKAGFMIELDDFGTGYSSLEALNVLDIDILKIDRSIVQEKLIYSKRSILEFCMNLAKIMKLKTVAEGVETKEQLERIRSLGCDYIQGFYYAKALSRDEFELYLRIH